MDPVILALAISTAVLILLVVFLAGMLMERRRRPIPGTMNRSSEPVQPEATFPREPAPWPDERPVTIIDRSPKPQLQWGEYRLYFEDGRYFFSNADRPDPCWECVGRIPKGHRIAVGADGAPRLQRGAATNRPTPHRRD